MHYCQQIWWDDDSFIVSMEAVIEFLTKKKNAEGTTECEKLYKAVQCLS